MIKEGVLVGITTSSFSIVTLKGNAAKFLGYGLLAMCFCFLTSFVRHDLCPNSVGRALFPPGDGYHDTMRSPSRLEPSASEGKKSRSKRRTFAVRCSVFDYTRLNSFFFEWIRVYITIFPVRSKKRPGQGFSIHRDLRVSDRSRKRTG